MAPAPSPSPKRGRTRRFSPVRTPTPARPASTAARCGSMGSLSTSGAVSFGGTGATLAGSGSVGAITLTSGNFLAPGNGATAIGTLSAASLTLNGGAFTFDLSASDNSSDLIALTGALTDAGLELHIRFLRRPGESDLHTRHLRQHDLRRCLEVRCHGCERRIQSDRKQPHVHGRSRAEHMVFRERVSWGRDARAPRSRPQFHRLSLSGFPPNTEPPLLAIFWGAAALFLR